MLSVTDCPVLVVPSNWVAKVRLVAESVAFGPVVPPKPVRGIDCGLPGPLSVTVREAVAGPS